MFIAIDLGETHEYFVYQYMGDNIIFDGFWVEIFLNHISESCTFINWHAWLMSVDMIMIKINVHFKLWLNFLLFFSQIEKKKCLFFHSFCLSKPNTEWVLQIKDEMFVQTFCHHTSETRCRANILIIAQMKWLVSSVTEETSYKPLGMHVCLFCLIHGNDLQ